MHSSGENSRKRKDDSDKRGEYRKFDQISSQMRETLIRQCAEQVIAHAAGNGGSCRRGFVKGLVDRASPRCSANNSDDKEEEDVDDGEGGAMGTTGLVFGHVESEDKSED